MPMALTLHGARGVVVSHPLSMREAPQRVHFQKMMDFHCFFHTLWNWSCTNFTKTIVFSMFLSSVKNTRNWKGQAMQLEGRGYEEEMKFKNNASVAKEGWPYLLAFCANTERAETLQNHSNSSSNWSITINTVNPPTSAPEAACGIIKDFSVWQKACTANLPDLVIGNSVLGGMCYVECC